MKKLKQAVRKLWKFELW